MKLFDKITPSIYRNIWGKLERAASDLIPSPADIVMLYRQSFVGAGGEFYKDVRPGVGAYDAGPGVSLKFTGTEYGKLVDAAGADTSITLVGDIPKLNLTVKIGSGGSMPLSGGTGDNGFEIYVTNTGKIALYYEGVFIVFLSETIYLNTLVEISLSRIAGVFRGTINGVTASEGTIPGDLNIRYIGGRYASGFLHVGNLYDIHIEDSTGVKFSNFLAQGGTSGFCESQVGPAVQLMNFTYPGAWEESLEFGHVWENYSEYEIADGQISGAHTVEGKVPQSLTTPTQDIFGNTLTNPGVGANPLGVNGFGGTFAGATEYLTNAGLVGTETVVSSIGTSTPTVSAGRIDFTAGTCSYIELSNGDTIVLESREDSLQPSAWDNTNGNEYVLNGETLGVGGFWSAEKEGSLLLEGGFYDDGTSLIPANPNTGLSVLGQPLTNTPGQFGGGTDGVEMVVNGNLTDGTTSWLPNDSAVLSVDAGRLKVTNGANLAGDGYQIIPTIIGRTYVISLILENGNNPARLMVGTGINNFSLLYKAAGYPIPTLVTDTFTATTTTTYVSITTTTPSTGQYCFASSISVQAIDTSALAPIKVYAPNSLAFYNLCVLAGVDEDFYLDGEPIGLTPLEVIALTPTGNLANAIFRSITKDTFLVGYNPALTGTDITKAEKYLGI